jgi:hypothetical protein
MRVICEGKVGRGGNGKVEKEGMRERRVEKEEWGAEGKTEWKRETREEGRR